jgi:hypothetical protein
MKAPQSPSALFTEASARRLPDRRLNFFGRCIALLAALWAPLGTHVAQAASAVWQNTGTDFNTGGNWSGGTGTGGIPGTGDNATFTGAEVSNPNLSASLTIQGITFSTTTTTGYTLSASAGQSLTLTNVGTGASAAINAANTSGANTISAPLILGGAAATPVARATARD